MPPMGYRTISHWRGHGILGVYSHDDTNAVPESQSSYSHPLSSSTKVRSPEASTMVALLAARFWAWTFHWKKMSSGSCSREQPMPVARGSMVVFAVVILELTNTVVVVR